MAAAAIMYSLPPILPAHGVKYRGSKLKKYQNYYVRVITRRHRNGQFCTVPEPSKKYYQYKFYIYDVY